MQLCTFHSCTGARTSSLAADVCHDQLIIKKHRLFLLCLSCMLCSGLYFDSLAEVIDGIKCIFNVAVNYIDFYCVQLLAHGQRL